MQVDPSHLEIHRIEFVLVGSNRASKVQRKMHMRRLQMKSAFLQMLMKLVQCSWLSTVDRSQNLENSRTTAEKIRLTQLSTNFNGGIVGFPRRTWAALRAQTSGSRRRNRRVVHPTRSRSVSNILR